MSFLILFLFLTQHNMADPGVSRKGRKRRPSSRLSPPEEAPGKRTKNSLAADSPNIDPLPHSSAAAPPLDINALIQEAVKKHLQSAGLLPNPPQPSAPQTTTSSPPAPSSPPGITTTPPQSTTSAPPATPPLMPTTPTVPATSTQVPAPATSPAPPPQPPSTSAPPPQLPAISTPPVQHAELQPPNIQDIQLNSVVDGTPLMPAPAANQPLPGTSSFNRLTYARPLDANVAPRLKAQIWQGVAINLAHLLPQPYDDAPNKVLHVDDEGQLRWIPGTKNMIKSIVQWNEAWRVYSVVMLSNPVLTSEQKAALGCQLFQYMDFINQLYALQADWRYYDDAFRSFRQYNNTPLSCFDPELKDEAINRAKKKDLAKKSQFAASSAPAKPHSTHNTRPQFRRNNPSLTVLSEAKSKLSRYYIPSGFCHLFLASLPCLEDTCPYQHTCPFAALSTQCRSVTGPTTATTVGDHSIMASLAHKPPEAEAVPITIAIDCLIIWKWPGRPFLMCQRFLNSLKNPLWSYVLMLFMD